MHVREKTVLLEKETEAGDEDCGGRSRLEPARGSQPEALAQGTVRQKWHLRIGVCGGCGGEPMWRELGQEAA